MTQNSRAALAKLNTMFVGGFRAIYQTKEKRKHLFLVVGKKIAIKSCSANHITICGCYKNVWAVGPSKK